MLRVVDLESAPSDRGAASMSQRIRDALGETPEVRDPQRQHALTERFLRPVLPGLERMVLDIRLEVDPALGGGAPGWGCAGLSARPVRGDHRGGAGAPGAALPRRAERPASRRLRRL